MFRTLVAAAVLLLPAFVFAGNVEEDFQKAIRSSGEEYVALRDALLTSADDGFLKQKLESSDFREKIVARAILGWKANGKMYQERLDADLFLSNPGNLLFEWGGDRSIIQQPEMIPLALEMLFKDTAGEPGLYAGSRIIAAVGRKGQFEDQDILFAYLSEMPLFEPGPATLTAKEKDYLSKVGAGDRRAKRDPAVLVAEALSSLPADQVPAQRVVATLYKISEYPYTERKTDKERAEDQERIKNVASTLAISLIRSVRELSPVEKNELLAELTSEEKLLGAVGPEATLNAAGLIGGPEASAALLKYLRDASPSAASDNKFDGRGWAFSLLRRMQDPSGSAALREYARDAELPAEGRAMALDTLAGVPFRDEFLTDLTAILEDSSAPDSVRFAALRALDQMFRANRGRREISGPLRTAILETSFTPQDEKYSGATKQIKDIVRNTK